MYQRNRYCRPLRNGPAGVAAQAGPPIVGSFAPTAAECRIPFNVTGTPAIAVPTGFTAAGLPLAMQIAGAAFAEPMVYRIAHACCEATGFADRRPLVARAAEAALA